MYDSNHLNDLKIFFFINKVYYIYNDRTNNTILMIIFLDYYMYAQGLDLIQNVYNLPCWDYKWVYYVICFLYVSNSAKSTE